MKNIFNLSIVLFISLISYSQNADDAKILLDEVSSTMNNYDNVYIEFDYTLENKAADVEQKNKGDVTIQGNKYLVNFFDTTQIYDGSKTYSIISENEEVNISTESIDDENTLFLVEDWPTEHDLDEYLSSRLFKVLLGINPILKDPLEMKMFTFLRAPSL